MFENGLFIFRRDLRIIDNTTLNLLHEKCRNIYTIFIYTPEQVDSNKNKYKSPEAVQFMIESLEDLSEKIKEKGGELYTFYGDNNKIIKELMQSLNIDIIGFNEDYSPYAIKRDTEIKELCETNEISIINGHDYYLNVPGNIINGAGNPYQKFTPYYKKAIKIQVNNPKTIKYINFSKKNSLKDHDNRITNDLALHKFTDNYPYFEIYGGRDQAILFLNDAVKTQKEYNKTRNHLNTKTSELSAYIKFGCISIREVYKNFVKNKDFVKQLIWRDFYANILFAYPHVLGHSLKPSYDKIKWSNNNKYIEAWKYGNTGFPIVDAGMRQLNQTGYMHNRARLIVASFLVKILMIDWRIGEEYFAFRLRDYDPASNNGNWQWISGGGVNTRSQIRIFNPWEQAKMYDPNCEYITQWIPELNDLSNNVILNWDSEYKNYLKKTEYYEPIVNL